MLTRGFVGKEKLSDNHKMWVRVICVLAYPSDYIESDVNIAVRISISSPIVCILNVLNVYYILCEHYRPLRVFWDELR